MTTATQCGPSDRTPSKGQGVIEAGGDNLQNLCRRGDNLRANPITGKKCNCGLHPEERPSALGSARRLVGLTLVFDRDLFFADPCDDRCYVAVLNTLLTVCQRDDLTVDSVQFKS